MTLSQSTVIDTNLGSAVAFRLPAQRTGVCFDYNNKECYYRICRYPHKCSACRGDQPGKQCNRMVKIVHKWITMFVPSTGNQVFEKKTNFSLGYSPISLTELGKELEDYPDHDAAAKLWEGFTSGFSLNYSGEHKSFEPKNLPSANKNPDSVR